VIRLVEAGTVAFIRASDNPSRMPWRARRELDGDRVQPVDPLPALAVAPGQLLGSGAHEDALGVVARGDLP
jgi:hypothetical protein